MIVADLDKEQSIIGRRTAGESGGPVQRLEGEDTLGSSPQRAMLSEFHDSLSYF